MGDNQAVVLLIDDVSAIVEELLTFMELNGIPAIGVSNLDQAMAALETHAGIRVLACDVRLGQESGLSIMDRVRDHGRLSQRKLQYLFITGDQIVADNDVIVRDYLVLTKPVQPQLLIVTLQQMLGDGVEAAIDTGAAK